jgi:hypothetical protein
MRKRLIFFLAIFSIVFSLLPFVLPSRNSLFLSLAYFLFMIGLGFIFDLVDLSFSGNSFLTRLRLVTRILKLLGFALLSTIILDGLGNFLGRLWFYSVPSFSFYLSVIFLNSLVIVF